MAEAKTKIIATIDAGESTGIVVSKLILMEAGLLLMKQLLATVPPAKAVEIVSEYKPEAILIEARPLYASTVGSKTWSAVYEGLKALGYIDAQPILAMKVGAISQCNPGIWKPVMRAQHKDFGGHWQASTDHEKDALNMQHYWLSINHMPGKDITYAS